MMQIYIPSIKAEKRVQITFGKNEFFILNLYLSNWFIKNFRLFVKLNNNCAKKVAKFLAKSLFLCLVIRVGFIRMYWLLYVIYVRIVD